MKRTLKTVALILAIILFLGICWFANALCGNPVSKMLAKKAAADYLKSNFSDTDCYIESVGFNFKNTDYFAHIRSDSSIDTRFTLYIDMFGNVYYDTYDSVTGCFVTAQRLDQEYRDLTDKVLEPPSFPYQSDIGYGTLEIYPREAMENADINHIPSYAIVQENLIIDHIYDIRELGATAGHLVIYVWSEELSYENAAEILLGIRAEFDQAGIPFRAIDFSLRHPKPTEGPWDDAYIGTMSFPYEEIYSDGLAERIKAADHALKAYYAELDAKEKEIYE